MKKARPNSPRRRSRFTMAALLAGSMAFTAGLGAAEVAHYTFDETAPPYADSDATSGNLALHAGTDAPGSGPGMYGLATQLQFTGGTSTGLTTTNAALATTSFSFSFFIRPVSINSNDNLLMVETATTQAQDFQNYDWRVSIQNVSGGLGAVQFTDRGNGGASGFAERTSGQDIPTGAPSNDYYHVAGSYNAADGAFSLYVRDVTANGAVDFTSYNGDPNIQNNDTGTLDVGTAFRADGTAVFFAASTFMDDLRVYNTALSETDFMGLEVPEPGATTGITLAVGLGLIAQWRRRQRQQKQKTA